MRTSPDARAYAQAVPNANPAEAFHAGVLHERARWRSLAKSTKRANEDLVLSTVARAFIESEGDAKS